MKHEWKKRRVLVEQIDAQRRWDRAYQMLLMWTTASGLCEATPQSNLQPFQEDKNGSERIYACLDPASGASAND